MKKKIENFCRIYRETKGFERFLGKNVSKLLKVRNKRKLKVNRTKRINKMKR